MSCLDSPASPMSFAPNSKGIKRKRSSTDGTLGQEADSFLSLKLGHSSSLLDNMGNSLPASMTISSSNKTDTESFVDLELDISLHFGDSRRFSPRKPDDSNRKGMQFLPQVDLALGLSNGYSESEITSIHQHSDQVKKFSMMTVGVNEGSTSWRWKQGLGLPPLLTSTDKVDNLLMQVPKNIDPALSGVDLSCGNIPKPKSSVTCTSGLTKLQLKPQHRSSSSKLCGVEGCQKGGRGASGRCISHGGGRRCQKRDCHKGAEGRTVYCKAHGGGRRCLFLGCTKSAEGRTDFCIAHGGGRRCSHDGCTRASRGKSGLCIRHGGGKRCQKEKCTKSAEGLSGLCITHGGGRRCQVKGCTKGAQGSTMLCKAHGGGNRCTYPDCTKGAEGSTPFCKGHGGGKRCGFQEDGVCSKSVHGGTNFCVAHGGGKRCAMLGCTKSARGRTELCVRHGGGKRCKFEGCGKSAQGSTDFCKTHGGGKRCGWGHPGTEYANEDESGPCHSFARGKMGLCALHSSIIRDKRVYGGVTLASVMQDPDQENYLIKMKTFLGYGDKLSSDIRHHKAVANVGDVGNSSMQVIVTEGRVHGGSLMAMLAAGSSGLAASCCMGKPNDVPQCLL